MKTTFGGVAIEMRRDSRLLYILIGFQLGNALFSLYPRGFPVTTIDDPLPSSLNY